LRSSSTTTLEAAGDKLETGSYEFDGEIKNLDLSKFVFKDKDEREVSPERLERVYENSRTKVKAIFKKEGLSSGDTVKLDYVGEKGIEYANGRFNKALALDSNPPTFDHPGDGTIHYNIAEDSGVLGNFLAKDPDGDEVSYTLKGDDKDLFQVVYYSKLVAVIFKKTPDPYRPLDSDRDNNYEVGVEVSDGKGGIVKQSIVVDVYHRGGSDNPYVWVLKEGKTGTDKLKFYGEDATGYTLEGADAGLFHIVDGALKFRDAQAYSENGDNTYEVVVVKSAKVKPYFKIRVVDDEVGDTNRAPVFDYKNSDKYTGRSFFYSEENKVFSFGATDPDGDVVRYFLKGSDRDSFDIDSSGNVSFKSGHPISTGGSWNAGGYIISVRASDGKGGEKESYGIIWGNVVDDSSSVGDVELLGRGIEGKEWF
jgi:hypothetical protein